VALATALQSVGCAVEVYERTPYRMTTRGAGIVVQPSLTALLSQVGASSFPTTRCSHRNYLSPNRGSADISLMPQRFTSWEAIYKMLLAAFPAAPTGGARPLEVLSAAGQPSPRWLNRLARNAV
jgi:2-polyprenyl-6-methoxyphenol hydroxylase-like FAD-dependent oxidoreductase